MIWVSIMQSFHECAIGNLNQNMEKQISIK